MKASSKAFWGERARTRSRWSALAAALLLTISLAAGLTIGSVQADSDLLLKPDVPKLDSTVPKSPTTLKGGVQHQENVIPAKPSSRPMTGAATNNNGQLGTGKFKFFSGHAKTDKHKPLKAQLQNQNPPLAAAVQSGIGIIGVKFVLAFGRPPVINRVFPGTPAFNEGLRTSDIIVAVDGVPTFGLSKEDVYQMIVGAPGTPVTVSVSRNGDFLARTMTRMDFNDIIDPMIRRDYLLNM